MSVGRQDQQQSPASVVRELMPQLKADLARLVAVPCISAPGFPEATRPALMEAYEMVVGLFRDGLTFLRALSVAVALWIVVLVFFFPVVGWGLFGLAIGPKLIVGSAIPHLLFAIFLWGLCWWAFRHAKQHTLGFKNS